MNFGAVILAGGKSSRMGADKARLPINRQSLLARQIKLVRSVGAGEVFISGRPDRSYAEFGCPVLTDRFPEAGPLAGIQRALEVCPAPLLLVLAVDMPKLNPKMLRTLIEHCTESVGIVPRCAGQIEPLAALYPRRAQDLAVELLTSSRPQQKPAAPGPRTFASCCFDQGFIRWLDVAADETWRFASWNTPEDIVGGRVLSRPQDFRQ